MSLIFCGTFRCCCERGLVDKESAVFTRFVGGPFSKFSEALDFLLMLILFTCICISFSSTRIFFSRSSRILITSYEFSFCSDVQCVLAVAASLVIMCVVSLLANARFLVSAHFVYLAYIQQQTVLSTLILTLISLFFLC